MIINYSYLICGIVFYLKNFHRFQINYFTNDGIHALQYLDMINTKDSAYKSNFYHNLTGVLDQVPKVRFITCLNACEGGHYRSENYANKNCLHLNTPSTIL